MVKLPKTKEERINHYRKLIEAERKHNYQEGICIRLGNLCGGYEMAPWIHWSELVTYYPELAVYVSPKNHTFTTQKRKKIIESLALRISKKKDIYKDTKIFK